MSNKTFKILSIDGGGIRGVYPAHILHRIQTRLNIDVHSRFDLITGASTGAIIAASVAQGISPGSVVQMYRNRGSEIFSKRPSPWWLPWKLKKYAPAFQSQYFSDKLKTVLKETFGDMLLGDIKKPLVIPATDIGNGSPHVFKSGYNDLFVRDKLVPLWHAVLASCSAPTFFDPQRVEEYLLADGGLWANNPSLGAAIEAQKRFNRSLDEIRVFSLGTGHEKTCYDVKSAENWGLINGWRHKEFINCLMSLQAQTTHNYLQLMLKKEQWYRITFESDSRLPLDDCSSIDKLITRADRDFTHRSAEISAFLNQD